MTDLKFSVVSVRIAEENDSKKYVVYKMLIESGSNDTESVSIERRYTDFRRLYDGLRTGEAGAAIEAVRFPGRALIGNLGRPLVATRAAAFTRLLGVAASTPVARSSQHLAAFLLQDLSHAHGLLLMHLYEAAKPVVENTYRVVSKVLTARSPAVLLTLCLLVGIAVRSRDPAARPLAALALHRFQAVSDVELLRYYVPLLHTAQEVAGDEGAEANVITEHLDRLRRQGIDTRLSQPLLAMLMEEMDRRGPSAFHMG